MRKRRLAVVVLVVSAVLFVLVHLRVDEAVEAATVAQPKTRAVTSLRPTDLTPVSSNRGSKRLEGRVLLAGEPVQGATVTAVAAHGDDVLSETQCGCDNHCGRKLLECGCPEAAAQLVELVSTRTGEAAPLARTSTDSTGHFVLEGLDEMAVSLWAESAAGIAFLDEAHAGNEPVELSLEAGRVIDGVVRDTNDQPIAGALVTAIYEPQSRFFDVQSDADGHFRIAPLPSGKFVVVAVAPGLLPDSTHVGRRQLEPISLTLSQPRTLGGVVREAGAPVSGATVKLDGMHRVRTTTTDDRGHFSFERLRSGKYDVLASHAEDRAHVTTNLGNRFDRDDLELDLEKAFDVQGRVLDESGAPVTEATAWVMEGDAWRSATTDSAGHFTLDGVRRGTHWFSADKDGYVNPESVSLSVVEGMEPVALTLVHASSLSGRAVGPSGAPVTSFTVRVIPLSADGGVKRPPNENSWDDVSESTRIMLARGPTVASVDGGFTVEVKPGLYRLEVLSPAFAPAVLFASAPANELLVTMRAGAHLSGTLLDAAGAPVSGAVIAMSYDSTRTDLAGQFHFDGLAAGTYALSVQRLTLQPGESSASLPGATVTLKEGETTSVVLRLRQGFSLEGTVVEGEGIPMANAFVVAEGRMEAKETATLWTNATGRFRISGLSRGEVVLRVSRNLGEDVVSKRLTTPASGVVVRFPARPVIKGRVVGDSGQPVLNFSVNTEEFVTKDGRFTLPVPRSTTQLAFESPGYVKHLVALKEGVTDFGDIPLSRGTVLAGRVFDVHTKKGLENAWVDVDAQALGLPLDESTAAARTDFDGRFHLRVDPGVTFITVSHAGYLSAQVPVKLDQGPLEMGLDRGATLTVSVEDAEGHPRTGVHVWAAGPDAQLVDLRPSSTTTYSASTLAHGEWLVQADGHRTRFRAAKVAATDSTTYSVTLHEATDGVEVVLRGNASGFLVLGPVPDFDWTHLRLHEFIESFDGKFKAVPPGLWSLVLLRKDPDETMTWQVLPLELGSSPLSVHVPLTGWRPIPHQE